MNSTPDPKQKFWKDRSVLVTGHTGFKGSWLCLWLSRLGARVTGFSLPSPTIPSQLKLSRPPLSESALFDALDLSPHVRSISGDVRALESLQRALQESEAEIVFHLAAQSLVLEGYRDPVKTYSTNVMGTVNLLESVRSADSVKAVIVVTSDKCYEPSASSTTQPLTESSPLGGNDPYASSKASAEFVARAYSRSFSLMPKLATARAGNVIGGGDWAENRLVPDIIRAWQAGDPLVIRHPQFIRPWQHVLEPLSGYLGLAQDLVEKDTAKFSCWNFGPPKESHAHVEEICLRFQNELSTLSWTSIASDVQPAEDSALFIDSEKARKELRWTHRWSLDQTVKKTAEWYRSFLAGRPPLELCSHQIDAFEHRSTTAAAQ